MNEPFGGTPPSTFLFLRGRAPIRESEVSAQSSGLDDLSRHWLLTADD